MKAFRKGRWLVLMVGVVGLLTVTASVLTPRPKLAQVRLNEETWDWASAMQKVAKEYRGEDGKVILIGDSLTFSVHAGKWARYGRYRTRDELAICEWMQAGHNDQRNGWWLAADEQGDHCSWTAASGCSSTVLLSGRDELPSLDELLQQHTPEIVMILLGTNDLLGEITPRQFLNNMETIYTKCLDQGAIPVVQTIPPTTQDKDGKLRKMNDGLIALAAELELPLLDLHKQFLQRRPGDTWLGTLVGAGGTHFTYVSSSGPATEENLNNSGYLLRCWLQVHKIAEIKKKAIDPLN